MSSISLKLGYKYLKSNKGGIFSFTTLLAIVGLSIGISSLIVVTSVMNGFEKELENRILGVIPHSVLVSNDPINDYELFLRFLIRLKLLHEVKQGSSGNFCTFRDWRQKF